MALSSCSKCNGGSFEMKESSVSHATYRILFIQCSSCGCVVGTQSYFDAGFLAKKNQEAIAGLSQQLAQVQTQISAIQRHLQRQ